MWLTVIAIIAALLAFAFRKRLAHWARYLYYMRFAILLWAFPLLLIWANSPSFARSMLSGIVTPWLVGQYLCVAFFLFSASCVALILARIVTINGEERFGDACPPLLHRLLADDSARFEWIAPLAAQLNNALVLWYFLANGHNEEVDRAQIAIGFALGVGLAFIFWYIVNAFYYLSYRPRPGKFLAEDLGWHAARTILFPRSWLCLSTRRGQHRCGDVLEKAELPLNFNWVRVFFQIPGYRWAPDGDLYEAHYFSLIAAAGYYALLWVLWPITAPVPAFYTSCVFLGGYLLSGIVFLIIIVLARPARGGAAVLWRWKAILGIAVMGFGLFIPYLYRNEDAERFPVLALLLLLAISSAWTLGAIAFFADRFRIPVLTVILLYVFLPRLAHLDYGYEEHYLSTSSAQSSPQLPTPDQILQQKLTVPGGQSDDRPLFIVTSTGGGIHAAAWTAAVLRNLERAFAADPSLGAFHDHVLLLSTVSGGSSGLYTYLRELDPNTNNGRADWARMVTRAQCSSLEAVGWGLVYYDVPKAFMPFASDTWPLKFVWPLSPGAGDLNQTPLGKDRTWALRKAFARNLEDPYCLVWKNPNALVPLSAVRAVEQDNQKTEDELALSHLDASTGVYPAFTMNTTTVENGERFLLANYRIPDDIPGDYRARSFLATYGGNGSRIDLPLATAAQMSATFPVVSSAARVPWNLDPSTAAVHFVDGGYFDNDGTASALEFLRYALIKPAPAACNKAGATPKPAGNCPQDKSKDCPLRIVLIEIRNSGDVSPSAPEQTTPDHPGGANRWNFNDEAEAPIEAFLEAGHDSITGRNRVALALLERALRDKVEIRHIVISDNYSTDTAKTDPLNWSLTPRQEEEVWGSAEKVKPCYDQVLAWFRKSREDWKTDILTPETTCVPPDNPAASRPTAAP